MKKKLVMTFLLLILCAGSVTAALKSFDNVTKQLQEAKDIQAARLEAAATTPTPTPEPVKEEPQQTEEAVETPTPEPVDPSIPVLTLTSDKIEIAAGSSFSVVSAVADITDDKDDRSTLFRYIHVTGNYDLRTPGQYTLDYVVTDTDGNTSLPQTLTLVVK